jgi:hypothetical protein
MRIMHNTIVELPDIGVRWLTSWKVPPIATKYVPTYPLTSCTGTYVCRYILKESDIDKLQHRTFFWEIIIITNDYCDNFKNTISETWWFSPENTAVLSGNFAITLVFKITTNFCRKIGLNRSKLPNVHNIDPRNERNANLMFSCQIPFRRMRGCPKFLAQMEVNPTRVSHCREVSQILVGCRVTRRVCENIAQNEAQPFLSQLLQNYYHGEK